MHSIPPTGLSRRAVLLGAAGLAGTVALAACGSSSTTNGASGTDVALEPDQGVSLIAVFGASAENGYVVSGTPQRLAFALGGADGSPTLDIPETLDFQVVVDGAPVGAPISVSGHRDGVPIGYFPLRTTFDRPGNYQAQVTVAGKTASQAFSVIDPSATPLLQRGGAMRPVDTPTFSDAHGVDPICTQPSGTCPFHTQTVTEALATGKPTALLVSTPQFCQIGVCGPVLELLTEIAPQFPGVQVIHAEVYANARAILDASTATTSASGIPAAPADAAAQAQVAPVIDTYGLTYEPALFLADGTGRLVDRLDNVFDRPEITQGLQAIAG